MQLDFEVTPAKAGVRPFTMKTQKWIPASIELTRRAGMTLKMVTFKLKL